MLTEKRETFAAILRRLQPTDAGAPGYGMGWDKRHRQAWASAPIGMMLRALAKYADDYERDYGDPVGTDYVLGDAWRDALSAVSALLDGDLGGLDGGTCSGIICAMFERAGFTDEGLDRA